MAKVLAGTAAWTIAPICQQFPGNTYRLVVRTLGGSEVDDVSIALEHVDLLNGLDGLDVELLQRGLELLVIAGGPRGRALDLPPGSTLATIRHGNTSESRPPRRMFQSISADSCLDIPCRPERVSRSI
jgi:hypothetical protein